MDSIDTEVCDDPGKRDRQGRRVLGRDEWHRLMAEYDESGLTQEAFCKREGVNYHTFVAWLGRRKRGGDGEGNGSAPAKFHELTLSGGPAGGGSLEVALPDGTVLRGGDADALARLARLLRS